MVKSTPRTSWGLLDGHLGLQGISRPSLPTTPLCPSPICRVHMNSMELARAQSSHVMDEERLVQGLRVGQDGIFLKENQPAPLLHPQAPGPIRTSLLGDNNMGNIFTSHFRPARAWPLAQAVRKQAQVHRL